MSEIIKISDTQIQNAIFFLRGKRVILDSYLAEFYGVSTKVLNQAVKRKIKRFSENFVFGLTQKEKEYVVANCDHLKKLKFSPFLFEAIKQLRELVNPPRRKIGYKRTDEK